MQRRAAALWAVFFLVVGAGAYSIIAVAEQPAISLDGETYARGDQFTVDGRTYNVSEIKAEAAEGGEHGGGGGGATTSATLAWTEKRAQHTATLDNNSTVPPTAVKWDGQAARHSATLRNNTAVPYNGSQHELVIASGSNPSSFTLRRGGNGSEFNVGDSLVYRGNRTTVTSVTSEEVTLVWGDPYRVLIPNESDPSTFTLRAEQNVTAILESDPEVENKTVTRADGRKYVVFKQSGRTQLLSEYLPTPETTQFSEGATLEYKGNKTTVENVTKESVTLAWRAPKTHTVSLGEGETASLNGQRYVAHFPDDESVVLSTDVNAYREQVGAQERFHERINGLWGVTILSGITFVLLIAVAYMPLRR